MAWKKICEQGQVFSVHSTGAFRQAAVNVQGKMVTLAPGNYAAMSETFGGVDLDPFQVEWVEWDDAGVGPPPTVVANVPRVGEWVEAPIDAGSLMAEVGGSAHDPVRIRITHADGTTSIDQLFAPRYLPPEGVTRVEVWGAGQAPAFATNGSDAKAASNEAVPTATVVEGLVLTPTAATTDLSDREVALEVYCSMLLASSGAPLQQRLDEARIAASAFVAAFPQA